MPWNMESPNPVQGAKSRRRRRRAFKDEALLVIPPTLMVFGILFIAEFLNRQRLLWGAYLLFFPYHGMKVPSNCTKLPVSLSKSNRSMTRRIPFTLFSVEMPPK